MNLLSILFLSTALIYSSVGFGGGSTYLALLLIWGIPYSIVPLIALFCNIVVVSGNCFNYARAGNINIKLLAPYLIGSIPFSFIGGSLPIEKKIFEILLFFVLITAGILLLLNFRSYNNQKKIYREISKTISVLIGAVLGFFSGVVGIGGGIFLSPILFLFRAAKPQQIITTASLFILINSVSGIIGQLTKNNALSNLSNYWYLILAVLIGGQIGNYLNLKIFPVRILALLTSILVIFVGLRIGFKILNY